MPQLWLCAYQTNRKAGEFYTPRSVVRLMVKILDPKEGQTIYGPTCGTAGTAAISWAPRRRVVLTTPSSVTSWPA